MSDTDSLDYLQTGFDPSSLTVPRLRSILVSHDIKYPSGAKKPQLVQIFTDKVLPQSRKILSARSRAKRTSRGITDADSQDSTVADEEVMPPPPTPRARASRRTTRVKSEESESDVSVARSPTKRTRTPSTKHPRASDTETGTDPDAIHKSIRKSRKSEAPTPAAPALPPMRPEIVDDGAGVSRRESAFTYDNPFQSGSSPPPGLSSGERKLRKSLGSSVSRERKSMSNSRRSTSRPQAEDGFHPPTSSTFEIPVSALNGMKDVDENGVEASEEFTPEEQLALVQDIAANGESAVGPLRPKRKQNRGISKKGPLSFALFALLSGYGFWYRQEKLAVGYCGVGRDATPVIPAGVEVPDWARILHAYCSANMETTCELDFVKKPHPMSLGDLVPLPPTCEPDGEKVRRVKAVADRAVEELRERRAKFECGELTNEAGQPEPTVEIDAEELKKEVSKKRRKGMSEAEFEELWGGAIGEIQGRDEVMSVADGSSLARLPLVCAIRRSFRLTVARHRLKIASIAIFLSIIAYIRSTLHSRATANAAVPHLVSLTLERLATQAALHAADKDAYPEDFISIGQLRDDVLRDEHSIKKRAALWERVKRIVEHNSNVRIGQRESRNGEISKVWEWVGNVASLESGYEGAKRRKSGRRGGEKGSRE
ncbi:uncharacterized protein LY89DRAFT_692813 [Mollisia scopiformis]|uniref:Uncharacterized protein n=1 Tax=Mollisia scopiformis TaxID=149040 RepID=A0A194XUG5_MOLSC|nr:uncharacterized protein LY89DRAFT_692813 [Mollisia scopiformis]KUJ23960.1 hypothetical protein LY89DRAFT_692813 [Mollisia scopiformis]